MKTPPGVIRNAGLFAGNRVRAVLALAGPILLCPGSPAAQFEDVTAAAGLTDSGAYCFAAAWGDIDNDRFPDLFIAAGGAGSRTNFLYRNLRDGTFAHVGTAAGPIVTDRRDSLGCAWVDFNNDGHRDLLLINGAWSAAANDLYWNNGSGTFSRGSAGRITSTPTAHSWPACADYDGDGWIDFYLSEVVSGSATTPRLYHATGHGTFIPVDIGPPESSANDAVWGDFDNDGDPDLFTCNYTAPSALWRNDGHGQFTRMMNGLPANLSTLHAAWADYDRDGDLDIALGSFSDTRIYRNDGAAGFLQVARLTGAIACPTWADYDNDGHPDLLAAVGQNTPMKAVLYHNNGDGTFARVEDAMSGSTQNWMGTAWADYDNDGDLDVVFLHQYGRNRVYRNLNTGNHWLKLDLTGVVSNRDAIGAKVRVQATIGGQVVWQMQEVNGGYQVQHDNRPHFGLGDATNVDLVRIEWPSGNVQQLTNVAADQIFKVTETVPITPRRIVANPNGTAIFLRSGEAVSRQWQFEGADLPGQTGPRLTLTNLTLAQQGRYSLVADTGAGMETNHAFLVVDPHFSKVIDSPVVTDKVVSWTGHFGDVDGDGLLDLLVKGDYAAAGQNTRLYHNTGGQFSPVTTGPWANLVDRVGHSPWADVDNDGDLDVLMGVHESAFPFYVRNDGGGAFTRLPVDRNWIQPPRQVGGWVCAWADVNCDGLLDALLSGSGTSYPLLNRGDGSFGILTNSPMYRMADWPQGVVFVDYDNDGDPDLFLPGETGPARLCRNEGEGRFTDVSSAVLQSRVDPGLGGAFGDFDNDGDWDLFTVGAFNGQMREAFLVNNGDGTFSNWDGEPKALLNLGQGAPFWGDYDNDGLLDLFITKVYGGRCQLFRNQGDGNFLEITSGTLVTDPRTTHSAALADYNNDGNLDVFLAGRLSQSNCLYENHGNGNHWLKLRLKGTASNSHGVGARILPSARTGVGGKLIRQMRQISAGSIIQELEAHFGLGTAPSATLLRIEWPSGTVQEVAGVKANQILTVWEPPALKAAVQPDGSCRLDLRAEPNRAWQIQASTDLVEWQTLATVTPTTVASTYTDAPVPGMVCRFYRVRSD